VLLAPGHVWRGLMVGISYRGFHSILDVLTVRLTCLFAYPTNRFRHFRQRISCVLYTVCSDLVHGNLI
jgi:hypothetical protein